MQIETDSPAVMDNLVRQLSALKSCHPHECMTCFADGNCELQKLWARYGITQPGPANAAAAAAAGAEPAVPILNVDKSSGAIIIDYDKCIKCGRCVTMCQDVQNMNVLGWVGKGKDRHPGVLAGTDLDQSKCIEASR